MPRIVVRFVFPGLAVLAFTLLVNHSLRLAAAEPTGLDALTNEASALSKGEVIAFFGDSITQGGARPGGYCRIVAEAIEAKRPELDVEIVYAGISGHKVPNLQERLDRDVLAKKPTIVLIYIGINDVWHSQNGRGTSKEDFDSGLRDLIKRITATGAKVVLCTPSTIGEKTDGSNDLDAMLEEYSTISRKVAADTKTHLCDLRQAFLAHLKEHNPQNVARGILTGDGVHLNAAGNQFVAAQAAQAIAAALRGDAVSKADTEPTSLFNGKDLSGWHVDIPAKDTKPDLQPTFIVRDGMLVSLGSPRGHIITDASHENYRLEVEYRFAGEPGNCGVLVHASTPRALVKMFPQSIEVQMNHTHAGDFWCIVEDITVPDMVKRRGPKENWGITIGKGRRILNLTDGSEAPLGEWNRMTIECVGDEVMVWVNNDLVNHGTDCTASKGQIALQAEGAEVEFRKLLKTPISKLSTNQ
jgi:lysophospholipase L1-like esterase